MIKIWKQAAAVAIGLGACGAIAAAPNIEAVVKARQANYKEIGGAFKTINDEVKSGAPDMNTVRPLARDIASRAAQTLKYFPRASGPQSGAKTRAKAEIWTKQAEFMQVQKDMIAAANELNAAAVAGDAARMQKARGVLGGTCKACHDQFREEI